MSRWPVWTTTATSAVIESQALLDLHRMYAIERSVLPRSQHHPIEVEADGRRIAATQVRRDEVPAEGPAEHNCLGRPAPSVRDHHMVEVVKRLSPSAHRSKARRFPSCHRSSREERAPIEDLGCHGRRCAVTYEFRSATVGVRVAAALACERTGARPLDWGPPRLPVRQGIVGDDGHAAVIGCLIEQKSATAW